MVKVEWGGRVAAEFTVFLKWAGGKAERGRQGSHLKIPTEAWHCSQGREQGLCQPSDPGMLGIAGGAGTLSIVSECGPSPAIAILEGPLPLP